MQTEKEMKLTTGVTIPKGIEVIQWRVNGNYLNCRLASGHVVRIKDAFNVPSDTSFEKWLHADIAEAIDGAQVEPDGYSPDGAPSWLLVCGLVFGY